MIRSSTPNDLMRNGGRRTMHLQAIFSVEAEGKWLVHGREQVKSVEEAQTLARVLARRLDRHIKIRVWDWSGSQKDIISGPFSRDSFRPSA